MQRQLCRAPAIHCFQVDSLAVVMVPLKEFQNPKKPEQVIVFAERCPLQMTAPVEGYLRKTRKQKQSERNLPHKLNCR